jgi:hypothetical protein
LLKPQECSAFWLRPESLCVSADWMSASRESLDERIPRLYRAATREPMGVQAGRDHRNDQGRPAARFFDLAASLQASPLAH